MSSPYKPYQPFNTPQSRLLWAVDQAPSILNTKPWKFDKLADDRIELRPRWDRHLKVIDPRHRELLISCGAALFNLRMAIRVTGHDPVVWLLPDEEVTAAAVCPHCNDHCGVGDLLASVEIIIRRTHPVTVTEQRLYEAIPQRHTIREPFSRSVPMNVLAELEHAARTEGADAKLLNRKGTKRLLRWAAQTDRELKLNKQYLTELRQWTGSNAAHGLGVPANKFGPEPRSRRYSAIRNLGLAWPRTLRDKKRFENPQLIALQTESDKPSDWMRAGQALQRLLLTATYHRIQASFLTQQFEEKDGELPPFQPTQQWWRCPEYPQMIIRLPEYPQMIIRLGEG